MLLIPSDQTTKSLRCLDDNTLRVSLAWAEESWRSGMYLRGLCRPRGNFLHIFLAVFCRARMEYRTRINIQPPGILILATVTQYREFHDPQFRGASSVQEVTLPKLFSLRHRSILGNSYALLDYTTKLEITLFRMAENIPSTIRSPVASVNFER